MVVKSSKKTLPKTPASESFDPRNHIVGLDTKVPLLNGKSVQYINFDNAASTPPLVEVMEAINEFMPWYSSVHRGTGFKSIVATKAYEDARRLIAEFFGANEREHVVIFGKNTTEAINKLSYRLPLNKKDIVLISLLEHHSNDLPWRKHATVKRIKTDKNHDLDENHLKELLKTYRGRVKLVAITGASNVTGVMPDIHSIARLAHAAGAEILVDCAQLAPHRAISIRSLDDSAHLDYIAVSAHKMYAPFGTGALIGRRDTFARGEPEYCGGGTIDLVTPEQVEWTTAPERDEAGSPNVVGAVAMAAALNFLEKVGMDRLAEHEAKLTLYALQKLGQIKNVKIFGGSTPESAGRRLGVVPFAVTGLPHGLVSAILGTEWGIGVRNGCFCAHSYIASLLSLEKSDIQEVRQALTHGDKSHMPGLTRISFGMYNTEEEIDRFAEALSRIAAGKFQGKYQQDKKTGDFTAAGWQPKISFV